MNELMTTTDAPQTMSSQAVADLVNVRHDNVKRTISELVTAGVIDHLREEKVETAGRPSYVHHLTERDSYIVVAQLSPEFTAKVVDRWRELETQNADLRQQLIETQQQEIKRLSSQVKRTPTFDRPEHFCLIEDDTLADVACIPLTHVDKARKAAALPYDDVLATDNRMMGAFSPEGCLSIIDHLPAQVHHRVRWDNLNDFFDHAVRAAFRRSKVYTINDYRRERKDAYWANMPKPLPWQQAIQKDSYPVHDQRLITKGETANG